MFIDEASIYVHSGRVGDGFVHFHREKFVSRGGPDGGDGGYGGDVVLEVQQTLNTLSAFRHTTRFVAQDGAKGVSITKLAVRRNIWLSQFHPVRLFMMLILQHC